MSGDYVRIDAAITIPSASRRLALMRAEQPVDCYHASRRDADGTGMLVCHPGLCHITIDFRLYMIL